jgi:hypothetical protein
VVDKLWVVTGSVLESLAREAGLAWRLRSLSTWRLDAHRPQDVHGVSKAQLPLGVTDVVGSKVWCVCISSGARW